MLAILAHPYRSIALHSYLAPFRGHGCTQASIQRQRGARTSKAQSSRLIVASLTGSRHSLCNHLLTTRFCPHKNIEFLEIAP